MLGLNLPMSLIKTEASLPERFYPLITLGLGPLLMAQGRRVRRETPRLPEAEGARDGRTGNGASLRLLIAGDSAAAGVGVEHQDEALAGRLLAELVSRYAVQWQLQATSGHTLADLLAQLESIPAPPVDAPVDVVVLSIGVNDATSGISLRQWQKRLQSLLILLQTKFAARHVLFSTLPPMHHFPALPQPLRWYMGLRAQRLNRALADTLRHQENVELAIIDFPHADGYIAHDGFHPGAVAYALWAAQLGQIIQRRFPPQEV